MSHYWQAFSVHQGPPTNAVYAGHDSDGSPIYIGRAFHNGEQLPAKVMFSKQAVYVCAGGKEIRVDHFELLLGSGFVWVASSKGAVIHGAVVGGKTGPGEILYIGRANHKSSLTPGKIHPSHQCLYIPYGGKEVTVKNYEVLCQR